MKERKLREGDRPREPRSWNEAWQQLTSTSSSSRQGSAERATMELPLPWSILWKSGAPRPECHPFCSSAGGWQT